MSEICFKMQETVLVQFLFNLKVYRVYSRFKMWTVHFFTFHHPHAFLSSGSEGWPSKGTGLSNMFKKSIIQALNTFASNSCFGISSWKEKKSYVNNASVEFIYTIRYKWFLWPLIFFWINSTKGWKGLLEKFQILSSTHYNQNGHILNLK